MAMCPTCGAQFADGTRFCPQCGAAAFAAGAAQGNGYQQADQQQQYQQQQYQQQQYQQQYQQQQYQQQQYQQQQYQQQYQQPVKQAPVAPSKDAADYRVLMALSYLFVGFLFIALILAPKSDYVRKHANQVIALNVWYVACALVCIVPVLGWIAGGAGSIAGVVFMIICISRACKYEFYQIPIFGKWNIVPRMESTEADGEANA